MVKSMKDLAALEKWLAMGTRFYTITTEVEGLPRGSGTKQPLRRVTRFGRNNLAELYYAGLDVPQDNVRAYMWVNLAAVHMTGDEQKQTVENRDDVARRMTPAQVAEAKRLTQQCQARKFNGC